jgi:hypothetical protein
MKTNLINFEEDVFVNFFPFFFFVTVVADDLEADYSIYL